MKNHPIIASAIFIILGFSLMSLTEPINGPNPDHFFIPTGPWSTLTITLGVILVIYGISLFIYRIIIKNPKIRK